MNKTLSALTLVALAVLGTGGILILETQTASRLADSQQAIQTRNLLQVLPTERYDNQPLDNPLAFSEVPLPASTLIRGYQATLGGQPSAVILQSQVTGYGGRIELLIGIGADGKLLGVKTLNHHETSGLGARIADQDSAWLKRFEGKSLGQPMDTGWALKKDNGQFDQMAGATITSRAVIQAIHDALRYFDEHRAQLLGKADHE